MPRRDSRKLAAGYWVTYETDMGPVPQGTPGLCMKDCMSQPDALGNDCVLFWANHRVKEGKTDGNVWMVGKWEKCSVIEANAGTWPGGKKSKKAAEKLLDKIFKKGDHVTKLLGLQMLMDAYSSGTAIIDGPGEGAWEFPAAAACSCEPSGEHKSPRAA